MTKALPVLALVVVVGTLLLVIAPVPRPTPDNTFTVEGELVRSFVPDNGDLVLELAGDDRHFYVNDDYMEQFDLAAFRREVEPGDTIELTVIRRSWTPLDPGHKGMPVATVRSGEETYIDRM